MCVGLCIFYVCLFVCFFPACGTYKSVFLPCNIKGNCHFISEFRPFSCNCEFTVSHNSDKV